MNARTLERLFLRFALVTAPLTGVACSSSGSGGLPGTCGSQTPGRTDATLAAITADSQDAGVTIDLTPGSSIPSQACYQLCPPSGVTTGFCKIESLHGDSATITCSHDCTGRRPDGLEDRALAGTFAEMARLEAASVHAFKRLRAELAGHGAPRSILRACSRAARDEVRHARATRSLARRRRESIEAPVVGPASRRSLEALAIENAVEGCVRETWGAFQATRLAAAHADTDVRDAMKRIARDETRHAALAWSIAAWLEPRLDAATRARVRAARDAEARAIAARAADAESRALASALWALS